MATEGSPSSPSLETQLTEALQNVASGTSMSSYSGDDNPTRAAYLAARRAQEGQDNQTDHAADPKAAPTYVDGEVLEGQQIPQTSPSPLSKRRNIEDCIADLENTSFYFCLPKRSAKGADTAVFIDPPSREPDISYRQYEAIHSYYRNPCYVHSKNLLATGSEKFANDLGPTAQFRIKRRRFAQIQSIQAHNPQITKFIDLTPKVEGLDAVEMLVELSCPKGVRLWGLACQRWGISRNLAGSKDDFIIADKDSSSDENGDLNLTVEDQTYQIPPDYSATRHRACIQRVLLAIEGADPYLNSAPKVYTTAVLAKSFGIKQSPLTDYVIRWLRAAPNTVFVEVLPEAALKIAECLQCESVARDAFAILVGERALEMKVERSGVQINKDFTVHHRRKEDLDETWENRIQYARLAFLDRIDTRFSSLVDENMTWVEELPSYKKLDHYKSLELDEFRYLLKAYIKQIIFQYLCGNYSSINEREISNKPGGAKLFSRNSLASTWESLKPYERIFTRTFWEILRHAPLVELSYNQQLPLSHYRYNSHRESAYTNFLRDAGVFGRISMEQLTNSREEAHESVAHSSPCFIEEKEKPTATQSMGRGKVSWQLPLPTRNVRWSRNMDAQYTSESRSSNDSTSALLGDARSINETDSSTHRGLEKDTVPLDPTTTNSSQVFTSSLKYPYDNLPTSIDDAMDEQNYENPGDNSQVQTSNPLIDPPQNLGYYRRDKWHDSGAHDDSAREDKSSISLPATSSESGSTRKFTGLSKFSEIGLHQFFAFHDFFADAENHLKRMAVTMLAYLGNTDAAEIPEENDFLITNVLLCLEESETKYLPLWAGGFDDGSNGVFGSDIPFTDHGFAPGPSIRGINSSRGSSEFSLIDGESSAPTSAVVHDGYGDNMDRRRTYATSDVSGPEAESVDWNQVYVHKQSKDKNPAKAYISDAGDSNMDSTGNDFDVITPTGNSNAPTADLNFINEELLRERTRKAALEPDNFDDIFTGDSDTELDIGSDNDSNMADADDDIELDGFTEISSYRGFDGRSTANGGLDVDMVEDRGENYGASKGKSALAKNKGTIVPGSIADMGRAYNPTYVYKDGPEDELMDRL